MTGRYAASSSAVARPRTTTCPSCWNRVGASGSRTWRESSGGSVGTSGELSSPIELRQNFTRESAAPTSLGSVPSGEGNGLGGGMTDFEILQDVRVFSVSVDGEHVQVDLYGGTEDACGSVRFTFTDAAERTRHVALLRSWE